MIEIRTADGITWNLNEIDGMSTADELEAHLAYQPFLAFNFGKSRIILNRDHIVRITVESGV